MITFGPTPSPLFGRARSYAARHATTSEQGAVVHEGVELAVLPARVHALGEIFQVPLVKCAPDEAGVQRPGINADHDRSKAGLDHLLCQHLDGAGFSSLR